MCNQKAKFGCLWSIHIQVNHLAFCPVFPLSSDYLVNCMLAFFASGSEKEEGTKKVGQECDVLDMEFCNLAFFVINMLVIGISVLARDLSTCLLDGQF